MATTKTLYFFTSQFPSGHSLFKLDITIRDNEDGDWIISPPEIIRHFSAHDTAGRNFMRCVKFGSKLLILGGERRLITSERTYEREYPLDVMVFDPSAPDPASDDALKSFNISPMNFGKLLPLVFEVGGKLYVIGGMVGSYDMDESLRDKTFEEYDPETNQWTLRRGPPIRHLCYMFCSALVLDCRTVVIQADSAVPLYIFDPTTYRWTKLELPPLLENNHMFYYSDDPLFFGLNPVLIDDCFYVAQHDGTFRKVGPIPISSAIANGVKWLRRLSPSDEVAEVEWRGKTFSRPWPGYPGHFDTPEMFHLGDWRFCMVETSTFHSENGNHDTGDYCIEFDVCILKVTNHSQGSLKAECVHAANFIVETGRLVIGGLVSCHLMNNDMPKKYQSRKRRKKIKESSK